MRITESQLRRIIRQEVRALRLSEAGMSAGRLHAMDAAVAADDGWSGSASVASAAGDKYDMQNAIQNLTGLSNSELNRLEKQAIDSLSYGGSAITPGNVIGRMAHLARGRR